MQRQTGTYGRTIGGLVTYARRGDDLVGRARHGFELRFVREARQAEPGATDEQIAATAGELMRAHMRAIASKPRPSRRGPNWRPR